MTDLAFHATQMDNSAMPVSQWLPERIPDMPLVGSIRLESLASAFPACILQRLYGSLIGARAQGVHEPRCGCREEIQVIR